MREHVSRAPKPSRSGVILATGQNARRRGHDTFCGTLLSALSPQPKNGGKLAAVWPVQV